MRFDLENSSFIWQDTLGRDCIVATIHHLIYTGCENGNAGVTPTLANASVVFGAVEEVWEKTTAIGVVDNNTRLTTALAYRLSLPTDMHVHYGAP